MKKELNKARSFAGRVGAIAGAGVIGLTMWVGLGGSMGAAPRGPFVPEAQTCLPTCGVDGRHLVVAGNDNTTLAAQAITIGLLFTEASNEANLNFELYDGDNNPANWDVPFDDGIPATPNTPAPELIVELWADPNGTGAEGAGAVLVQSWIPGINPFPVTQNGWNGVSLPHSLDASDGSIDGVGNYQYAVRITPHLPLANQGWNAFKVRAFGTVSLIDNQVVGFIASMGTSIDDFNAIFPNPPGYPTSTYDGTWVFNTKLPAGLGDVTVFDGDMDYGNAHWDGFGVQCEYRDTDDNDTPATPPGFANAAANPEGVATGGDACDNGGFATGQPADDTDAQIFRRMPTVTGVTAGIAYKLIAPDNQVFLNRNPSGNREWEQFKIQKVQPADAPVGDNCPVGGFNASPGFAEPDLPNDNLYPASDCRTATLPGGNWQVVLDGMDMQNLNFWYFSFKVEPIEPPCEGAECPGIGIVAPTNQTCFDYASGEIDTEYTMFYTQKGNNPPKIGNVAPGVIFFFTALTIDQGAGVLSVEQDRTNGSPVMLLHNMDARVYTDTCTRVPATITQDPDTGEVFFGAVPAGTYILQLKYQPKSLTGKPVPHPTPGEYTFTAQLDNVDVVGTQNDTPLQLVKK
jgi:hypothetical protein